MQGSIGFKKISELTADEKCENELINAVRMVKAKLAVVQRKICELTTYEKAEHEFMNRVRIASNVSCCLCRQSNCVVIVCMLAGTIDVVEPITAKYTSIFFACGTRP